MNKILASVLSSIFIAFSINAQTLENSTLWKISGNGIEEPSYLFGTIHITCDATLNEQVTKALELTSQNVMELDMDDPTMQEKMMAQMQMKDGKRIKDLISNEDYKILDAFITKNIGASLEMIGNLKPFMLTASLYPKMIDCPMQSYELKLVEIEKAQKEEIYGLESVDDQMKVFDDIPYEDQLKDLLKSAKDNMATDKANFSAILNIYNTQDITAMYEMINSEVAGSLAKYQDELLVNRNKNWIPKIKKYITDPTFIGVGAGHLAGKDGIINLLRNEGYILEPVLPQ